MVKHLIKKYTPDHEQLRNHRYLKVFGRLLHDPNLFHMNRRSVSGAFFVGMLCAFVPIFPQMITSAALAILCRVNLPISIALVWLTNPITIPPMFYVTYLVGSRLMGQDPALDGFQMSMEWLEGALGQIWWPLMLGGTVTGLVLGILSYLGVRGLWRWHIVHQLRKRQKRHQQGHQAPLE